MSYSLRNECGVCKKSNECNDAAVISGAIFTIHSLKMGHLGSGTIDLLCQNLDLKDEHKIAKSAADV